MPEIIYGTTNVFIYKIRIITTMIKKNKKIDKMAFR